MTVAHHEVVVIGGGQAGLATGHFLRQAGVDFVILDGGAEVGASWQARWRSLRLFTPAQYDGLPGLPFPGARDTFPTKDEMAAYLRHNAQHFELPIELGRRVRRLRRTAGGYTLELDNGSITAEQVVVATGSSPMPHRPPFAGDLDPGLAQVHAFDYQGPGDLPEGDLLVVGGGTSGVEIALELAPSRRVFLAGRLTFRVPPMLLRHAGGAWWWFISRVLTRRTPMGRKARKAILAGHGAPLIRAGAAELAAAGVTRVPRVSGTEGGRPRLDDGRVMDVRGVVWATGYRPAFSWIDFDATDESGWIANDRGVSTRAPGLYCVGVPFQYGLTSALAGGVGRDAAFVAERIAASRGATRSARAVATPTGLVEPTR